MQRYHFSMLKCNSCTVTLSFSLELKQKGKKEENSVLAKLKLTLVPWVEISKAESTWRVLNNGLSSL